MCSVLAFAALLPAILAAPAFEVVPRASNSCTFTTAADVVSGKASCSTITLSSIEVPAGVTLDLTGLKSGTKVIFEGTTTFGYKEWVGPLIKVTGTNIEVSGAPGHVIDGQGERWWDRLGGNGGKVKPKFFAAHSLKSSTIQGLNVKNTPVHFMSISSVTNLNVMHVTMDNSAGNELGHNTDAFNVGSSTGVFIYGANILNQDDCLAVNSGTNITFSAGTCSGGHGLSIGSVGGRSNNVVKDVTITNSKIVNSQNGVRIKTISGATGSVSGIRYSGIELSGIKKYGIVIEQDYLNSGPTGKATTGVPITDLTVSDVSGSVTGTDVYILCGKGSCSNWSWSGISITGGEKTNVCENAPASASC
ncbi:unnamed protein product [Discula destructiva]